VGLGVEQTDDLVARIVAAVRPERIILFGSHARGEARADSDIDVLVVAPEGAHRCKTAHWPFWGSAWPWTLG